MSVSPELGAVQQVDRNRDNHRHGDKTGAGISWPILSKSRSVISPLPSRAEAPQRPGDEVGAARGVSRGDVVNVSGANNINDEALGRHNHPRHRPAHDLSSLGIEPFPQLGF